METQLWVRGRYEVGADGEERYIAELLDGRLVVDRMEFKTTATFIVTERGYPGTPQGARRQAMDHWL